MAHGPDTKTRLVNMASAAWGALMLLNVLWLLVAGLIRFDLVMNLTAAMVTGCLVLVGLIWYPLSGRLHAGRGSRRVLLIGLFCGIAGVAFYAFMGLSLLKAFGG